MSAQVTKKIAFRQRGFESPLTKQITIIFGNDEAPVFAEDGVTHLVKKWDNLVDEVITSVPYVAPVPAPAPADPVPEAPLPADPVAVEPVASVDPVVSEAPPAPVDPVVPDGGSQAV